MESHMEQHTHMFLHLEEKLFFPEDTTLLFLGHGTIRGWGVSVKRRPLFTSGKNLVPIVQEAGWAPRSVWTGAENLSPTGIRSPDRPARSQSLYRLRYPAHVYTINLTNILNVTASWIRYFHTRLLFLVLKALVWWLPLIDDVSSLDNRIPKFRSKVMASNLRKPKPSDAASYYGKLEFWATSVRGP
jgi:hypothetical protein